MMRRQEGAAAPHILGLALLLLLLVGGLGLAEQVRAAAARTAGARALAAAVQSAARVEGGDLAGINRTFRQVLGANLPGVELKAAVVPLPAGALDPATGERVTRLSLSGRLRLEYRPEFLGRWLPPFAYELYHTEPVWNRNPNR